MEGIVIVHKPQGITSHDVVSFIRRRFRMRRVGHAGTLDPLATGVLVILLGKATRLFGEFEAFDKAYRATFILGTTTTSADIEGKVIEQKSFEHISREQVETIFKEFVGDIEQVPPMVSAIKVNGQRLYQLARRGVEVDRPPRHIHIHALRLIRFEPPQVEFYVECSKGTYIRQLAEDIGKRLGCGACIIQIERTKVGPFQIEEAITLDDLSEGNVRSWSS